MTTQDDKKNKIRELELSQNSNDLDFISPITEISFDKQDDKKVKFGDKSTELHKIEQQRSREELVRSNPFFLSNEFMATMTQRRKALEAQAAENRILWEQKRAFEIAERKEKERAATKARLLELEKANPTMRDKRLQEEQIKKEEHEKSIRTLQNKQRKAQEACELFFNLSESKFTTQYENSAVSVLSDSPVNRIISSRIFGSDRFGAQKYCYRCSVCKYSFEESLSLGYLHRHIYKQKDKHMAALIDIIDKEFTQKINETRFKFLRENSDIDYKNKKLDEDIENLKSIKTRVVQQ
jgi:hypothetical protein